MAKKRPKGRTNPAVREFHAIGKRLIAHSAKVRKKRGGIRGYGTESQTAAEISGYTYSKAMLANKFARMYDAKQLEELCNIGKQEGKWLNVSHVMVLIQIADGRKRRKLATECSAKSWSVKELRRQLSRHQERRYKGYRNYAHMIDRSQALMRLEEQTAIWLRLVAGLKREQDKSRSDDQRANIGNLYYEPASEAMEKLQARLQKEIKRLGASTS